ncbi:MAG: hypothetical protein RIR34_350 [Actinomycetota bacterium]|jgi:hypothetical protein
MKFLKLAAIAVAGLSLAGCSLLYPHWGATTFPTDGPTSSSTAPAPTASASATPSATTKPVQAAKVVILQNNVDATAGVVDVVAQISNVAEDGGQCTLTVTSGGTSKSQTVRAEGNVDTTQCFPMEVSLVGLAKGSASLTVTYKSAGYVGTSAPQVFNN